jgi:putative redox protein
MIESQGETVVIDETGVGPFQVEAKAGSATFLIDEPLEVGGDGSGPNPYDLLSAALGACTLMTVRLYARRKALPLHRVRVVVTHHRPALGAKDRFEREIELQGDLDETQRAKILAIAMRCPVHLTLERGSEIETRLVPPPAPASAMTLGHHARDIAEAGEAAGLEPTA